MKSRNRSANTHDSRSEHRHGARDVADFHHERLRQEQVIADKKASPVTPEGTYEYEQLVAEDAGLNAKPMIEIAAYYLAQRRDFAPGNELSDWFTAEAEIERQLRGTREHEVRQ